MKTKYPNLFGILAALMLVVSFVLPASLATTGVAADPGICKWDTLRQPGNLSGTEVIDTCTEPIQMAVGSDFNTVYVVIKSVPTVHGGVYGGLNVLKVSTTKGLFWGASPWAALNRQTPDFQSALGDEVYFLAMAPDNPKYIAVVTSYMNAGRQGPLEVWVSTNGGAKWSITNLRNELVAGEFVRSIDISVDYGGTRDIVVGTATGTGAGEILSIKSSGFSGWKVQDTTALGAVDFFATKFSPSYASDASLAIVYANATATYFNIALRDIDGNSILSWVYTNFPGVEVVDPSKAAFDSPSFLTLNEANLALPSDFSGQAASLRRAYISLDALVWGTPCPAAKSATNRDGIFRIDDNVVYVLMDTSNISSKSIYSIAYFGTYASGKLLAGERMGYPCTATVPTWFTDSPTTCPVPCWYPCLKCPTGAACQAGCTLSQCGFGGAIVAWAPQGNLAYAITSSALTYSAANAVAAFGALHPWWWDLINLGAAAGTPPICNDESAMSISRNNGETWNQISLIDTTITKFTDVAPTPDCKTIYLASVNSCADNCCGFDSVWRTSFNPDVTSPLAPQPVGTYWERVFTHVTAPSCNLTQTDYALLRVVPYCADPSGEIVAWAVYDPAQINDHGVAAWSPDFGDYWATLTPRNPVQDFCFESRTVLYFLSPGGLVQKMPYTGTAWSSSLPDVDSYLVYSHTIAAYPEGKVLVGAGSLFNYAYFATSYCGNFNTDSPTFALQALPGSTGGGNVHVAFDPNFKDNNTYFIGTDDQIPGAGACLVAGSVFRNNPMAPLRWQDTDMMAAINGAVGCNAPHPVGQYGIVLAFTGQALYSAHGDCGEVADCGVDRTIDDGTGRYGPLSGIPKPGIAWDHLDAGLPAGVCFTLEPSSLKICGCCTLDTDSTLYAIDDANYTNCATGALTHAGLIWAFTDCLAKRGPALITEDNALIGCDPVSGRAQEVNLCWEQLCVANSYDIEISKNPDFTILVINWVNEDDCGGLVPSDITAPCVFFPAGGAALPFDNSAIALFGNLECGHTYYWRVKARSCATTQDIRSPWSEVRSFTVKAGLPVVSPYLGLQLLAPNNGCLGCPVSPASFSWSPYKETTKYKFVLAKDSEMTQVVKEAEVTTTAYEYDGTLDYSTNYFWRVMSEEPAPSDWSATFSFQTEAKPAAPAGPAAPAPTPVWVWVVIAIGAILVIVTLVLIFKTRRV
jgi:hypothetical protein